jgi:flavin-dependent dehydrogenase
VSQEIDVVDVLVIGAGPSGCLASSLLKKQGFNVLVIEKQKFPRFSIGESLLPQLMQFLQEADLADVVNQAGFQFKNGAAFRANGSYNDFNFTEKFSPGPGTTFQVKRAEFDKLLADKTTQNGVPIRYQHQALDVELGTNSNMVTVRDEVNERTYIVEAGFVLDASGFGRVLPRILDLETPSVMPIRQSIFCHVIDRITAVDYDRNKILISVHPHDRRVWYWLIPFSDGSCSLGVVAQPEFFAAIEGDPAQKLKVCVAADPYLSKLLDNAEVKNDVQQITGYSANVKSLHGKNYALLGNAGEFLDPVFSSGVTIAFKSAHLAASLLIKLRSGESGCWQKDYAEPLMKGVDTFRAFVNAWYDGRLQDIIFYSGASSEVKQFICSILAGYAWDEANPYVAQPERRLDVLARICKN